LINLLNIQSVNELNILIGTSPINNSQWEITIFINQTLAFYQLLVNILMKIGNTRINTMKVHYIY